MQTPCKFVQHQKDACGSLFLDHFGRVLELHEHQSKVHFLVASMGGQCPVQQATEVRWLHVVGRVQGGKRLSDLPCPEGRTPVGAEPE